MSLKGKPTNVEMDLLKSVADYQFGKGAGKALFSSDTTIERSRSTNRIRYVYKNKKRIFSFRVNDGFLIPSIEGGKLLHENKLGFSVTANDDAEPFIREGKSLFAKHVVQADQGISPKDEVFIKNTKGEIIAIGTAKLSTNLLLEMDMGVGVTIRKGIKK